MIDKLAKMRYLLFIPFWGSGIIMFYLKIKLNTVPYVRQRHYTLITLLMGLLVLVGFIIGTLLLVAINKIINIESFAISYWGAVIALMVGGYFANIPVLFYVNYVIKKGNSEKTQRQVDHAK